MTAAQVYVLGGYQTDFARNWSSCTTAVSFVLGTGA